MSEIAAGDFLRLLREGAERGGFETDDVLGVMLPLMRQVLAVHESGRVAPLEGIQHLTVGQNGTLGFPEERILSIRRMGAEIESVQAAVSAAVEVVAESRRVMDVDRARLQVSDVQVGEMGAGITSPVYLPGYRSWEHTLGHHDQLTDVFVLGLMLGSLSCGLDFTDAEELEQFTVNRTNLFAIQPRLNPVVASTIVWMTELNRHKRAQELGQMIGRLEHYREQAIDFDTNLFTKKEYQESPIAGKRRLIQSHLRDRLFEISRRNRLIYFKPTLQTLNLTVASVPLVLDYRNIQLEQLFVWHTDLAEAVVEGGPLLLGKYLRFEEAPYIPGVLDRIIGEARRDRAEYGFAQLRLVLCFLRWNNLKEDKAERIHSPLLLLPCDLAKKKGVRDNYVLAPSSHEAEVNPALRHHLRELYNLELPESVDLRETSLDEFYEALKAQIQASEPGVSLNKIDRPQIELIHEKARQRLDQYRRRMKIQARKSRPSPKADYSYDRSELKPLGLKWFLERVRPTPLPMRDAAGAAPSPRLPHMVEPKSEEEAGKVLETERQLYALRDGDAQNPYSWDFDLCSLTLGNFNYRKMTLVRDYAKLIETDMASGSFDSIFSLVPKPPEEAPPAALPLSDQHWVIACDGTQASAISRARKGGSYIIQGPPGTGKSQTITNLIADYVARGKRVLFVCEKRAAIDVVFHRLRQQGLDELCCLIHDSQTDKKDFIQNLKQTYEKFLGQAGFDSEAESLRSKTLKSMEQDLAVLRRFSEVMGGVHERSGVSVRALLRRLVELGGIPSHLSDEKGELLPDYPVWQQHGDVVRRLESALMDLDAKPCFAEHPLRWLGKGVVQADRPLETLSKNLDRAESLLDSIESALELCGLPGDLWDTLEEMRVILEFASQAKILADRGLLGVLTHDAGEREFDALAGEINARMAAVEKAREKTAGWRDPLSAEDTDSALVQARGFENSILRYLQPSFYRLKKTLHNRYDFQQHAVAPTWSKVLGDLAALHQAVAALRSAEKQAASAWKSEDVTRFRMEVAELRNHPRLNHPSIRELLRLSQESREGGVLLGNLAVIHEQFIELARVLGVTLADWETLGFHQIADLLGEMREHSGSLAEMSPVLAELADLPDGLGRALRQLNLNLGSFEAAMAHQSVQRIYREDRAVNRFEGRTLIRKLEQLAKHHREWLGLNARCIRGHVRNQFLEHVRVSSLPAAQLTQEQKGFKKTYAAGRRDLEHEFGKTMRYKSIRYLAAGDTGRVIQDLKPIWLMSPLSVSDTLPLDPGLFDVVIFDEASQIPMEEAIPALYRSHQTIVVGDEMQLPPTTFFASSRGEDESIVVEEEGERIEMDLDADSFLAQSAQNLPSTLLAWHYRSRYESLISFSNAAFYSGNLYTIPDRQRAMPDRGELVVHSADQGETNVGELLARSISFHFMEQGIYEERRNAQEAAYIARLVRGLLKRATGMSLGVVAFSEAQQAEIENALNRLADEDTEFAALLETEYVREENDVFCGLFVKNLENVQGDERDIILMSVCYGHDANGRMLMNFGPINQRGGEKRLNVIFSRARHHMALVSSIRHSDITNDYNDGANSLKNFLYYAEAVSKGDDAAARRVLENLNPLSRKALAPSAVDDAVVSAIAKTLREKGYTVDLNVGQSKFRCDLAVRSKAEHWYQLGILVDTDGHYANPDLLDRYLMQPGILKAFGWRSMIVLTKDWYQNPGDVLTQIEKMLSGETAESNDAQGEVVAEEDEGEETAGTVTKAALPATVLLPEAEALEKDDEKDQNRESKVEAEQSRYFECVSGNSRKFWEITLAGKVFLVRFGRLGTEGQSQTKTFSDEAKARLQAEGLIAEKVKKGYVER